MSKKRSKTEIMASIAAVVAVAGLFIWIVSMVGGSMFGGSKEDGSESRNKVENTYESAVTIDQSDGNLSAEEFVSKYSNKWIKFDGILSATVNGSAKLYVDDKSLTVLQIPAIKASFDNNLQKFATDYRPDSPRAVTVVAYVERYDSVSDVVQLKVNPNIDGKTPSISSR